MAFEASSCLVSTPSGLLPLSSPGLPPSASAGSLARAPPFFRTSAGHRGEGRNPWQLQCSRNQLRAGTQFRRLVRSLSLRPSWLLASWADQTEQMSHVLPLGLYIRASEPLSHLNEPAGYDYGAKTGNCAGRTYTCKYSNSSRCAPSDCQSSRLLVGWRGDDSLALRSVVRCLTPRIALGWEAIFSFPMACPSPAAACRDESKRDAPPLHRQTQPQSMATPRNAARHARSLPAPAAGAGQKSARPRDPSAPRDPGASASARGPAPWTGRAQPGGPGLLSSAGVAGGAHRLSRRLACAQSPRFGSGYPDSPLSSHDPPVGDETLHGAPPRGPEAQGLGPEPGAVFPGGALADRSQHRPGSWEDRGRLGA